MFMDNPEVEIEKLVNGGQGLGTLPDGRRVFVWNSLPGERLRVRLIKKRKDYAEAIAEEVISASTARISPQETNYLSTSPWQMMTIEAENMYKKAIVEEVFEREHLTMPEFELQATEQMWQYRNKMEYSFWGDDEGLHLALHQRGSHGKQIVVGSQLAMPAIDIGAHAILDELKRHPIRAGQLKTVIVRANQAGEVVASLFVKAETFPKLELPSGLKGLKVYFSNPKSPASVPTQQLYILGSVELVDSVLGKKLHYDVDSFFQVNLPIFEKAVRRIKEYVPAGKLVVDMYGGVGSIGLSIGMSDTTVVELDAATARMARVNTKDTDAQVVATSAESSLECITDKKVIIVDPPRAGLHKAVTERLLSELPSLIIYLSCNPATHARDIALLKDSYDIEFFEAYNFFPRTPHIETLAVLRCR